MRHPLPDLNDDDVAWLAGLLEGEGCFSLDKKAGPVITVRMTDRDVIEHIHHDLFGNPSVCTIKKHRDKPIHVARATGEKARIIMRLVRPYMGKRRTEKIDTLL